MVEQEEQMALVKQHYPYMRTRCTHDRMPTCSKASVDTCHRSASENKEATIAAGSEPEHASD